MRIDVAHELGEAEAMRRIDSLLDDLARRDFKGVAAIKHPSRTWTGSTLALSVTVAKGFFQVPLSGTLRVSSRLVSLEAALPGMVTAFVGEDRVRTAVEQELARVLSGP
jgi:hypothetical protein